MIPYIIYGLIIGIASFVIFFCVRYFVVLPSKRKRMTEEATEKAAERSALFVLIK